MTSKSRAKHRGRGRALFAMLAAIAALTGGAQALSPAPAGSVMQEGEECPKVDFIFFETCEEENGGGATGPTGGSTPGAPGENPGGGNPAGDAGVPLDGRNELIEVTDTGPPPCVKNPSLCGPSNIGQVFVGDRDSDPRQPKGVTPGGGKKPKLKDPEDVRMGKCLITFGYLARADNNPGEPYIPGYQGILEGWDMYQYQRQHGMPNYPQAFKNHTELREEILQALSDWKEDDCESVLGTKLPVAPTHHLRCDIGGKTRVWCRGWKPPKMPS